MTTQTMQIGNRPCRIYGGANAEYLLLQMTGEHELQSMDYEVAAIAQSSQNFLFAAIPVESWNDALSPWKAPAVWGKQGFGGNAGDTLRFLTEQVIPTLEQQFPLPENVKIILGGYSLAGLFALWASTQTDLFYGVAAASPSVWFPGWMEFEQQRPIQAQHVYLSLGDKEERTKNTIMAAVGDNIRTLHSLQSVAQTAPLNGTAVDTLRTLICVRQRLFGGRWRNTHDNLRLRSKWRGLAPTSFN